MEQILLQQAIAAYQEHDLNKAENLFRAILQIAPNNCDALHLLGLICADRKKHGQAIQLIQQAIQRNPRIAAFYANLASSQRALHQYEEALKNIDVALQLNPQLIEALNTRGNVLRSLGRLDEALSCLNSAINQQPRFHEAYDNRGNVLRDMGLLEAATESYRLARQIAPNFASAAWNESLCLLLSGDLIHAWPLYEAGWELGLRAPWVKCPQPRWTGSEPIAGKTILLHAEQGLGDTIQFSRYADVLTEQGAHVILEVQFPLVSLLKQRTHGINILPQGEKRPDFDFHCPLLSLPGACKTTLDSIPKPLRLSDNTTSTAQSTTATLFKRPIRVGLVWSGNPLLENDRNRSVALSTLRPLFDLPIEFHTLQPDMRADDRVFASALSTLIKNDKKIKNFIDTAKLIEQMDLIISVDTAVAHLAASLGKPTWILLPFVPDWRWLMERTDSLWYPTARLFRQDRPGAWEDLLQNQLIPALQAQME